MEVSEMIDKDSFDRDATSGGYILCVDQKERDSILEALEFDYKQKAIDFERLYDEEHNKLLLFSGLSGSLGLSEPLSSTSPLSSFI